MKETSVTLRKNQELIQLVITGLFIALTYVFTAFINIQLPFGGKGGLIHLGNVPLFLAAILFGKKTGALAGGIGMGLFDLLSGWTLWAPFTLVIVALMGYSVGAITEKESHKKYPWYLLAMVSALLIKIVGYYFAEFVIYGNPIIPLASIPGNIIQVSSAIFLVLLVIYPLQKAVNRMGVSR